MQKPEVTAYLKTYCGWSAGVRAVLAKYSLPYTEKDIIQNPAFRWEMETKSGQPLSPCVEINGRMLADVSGEEVERYLVENKLVEASDATTDVPTNAPCANEQHEGVVKLRRFLETSPRLPRRTSCNSHFAYRAIWFSFAQREVRLNSGLFPSQ